MWDLKPKKDPDLNGDPDPLWDPDHWPKYMDPTPWIANGQKDLEPGSQIWPTSSSICNQVL